MTAKHERIFAYIKLFLLFPVNVDLKMEGSASFHIGRDRKLLQNIILGFFICQNRSNSQISNSFEKLTQSKMNVKKIFLMTPHGQGF